MSEEIRQVGRRIKDLREISECTVEETARRLGVSPEVYAAYEAGAADIPIGFLYEVAQHYHVELTALLTGDAPKLHRYSVSRKNKGIAIKRNDHYDYVSLAYNFHDKQIEPLFMRLDAEDPDVPIALNAHPGQEWDYVLSGTMRMQLGNKQLELQPGDSIYFDSSVPHGMCAVGGELTFLAIVLE